VGFHGQGGQAVARAFEQSGQPPVGAGDLRPQRLLLRGVQQQAAIRLPILAARLPGGMDKALPVQNAGRGPCQQAFRPASAMEGCGQSARGTVAGRNHQAAAAQPRVDLGCRSWPSFRFLPHSSVIRRWAGEILAVRMLPVCGQSANTSEAGIPFTKACKSQHFRSRERHFRPEKEPKAAGFVYQ
jgi:hypothetical protein